MSGRIDPVWGDDVMAIADAAGVTRRPEPIHPSLRGVLSDDALTALLDDWSTDAPIPYLPTDHDVCAGCGDVLCNCEQHCMDLADDVCGHNGRPYCPGCAPHYCPDCRSDRDRWSYDAEERGEWR